MAITPETLRQLRALTATVGGHVDGTVRDLTAAWLRAWDELAPLWQRAVADVVAVAVSSGRWPAPWELARINTVGSAVARTEQALSLLASQAGLTTTEAAAAVVAATAVAEPAVIAAQLPAVLADTAGFVAQLAPNVLDVIVRRTTEQITSLTRPLSDEASEAVRRALIRGIAVSDNPVRAAADMVARVEGAFNGGLSRAINIARTEMLDAYRETSRQTHVANADVLDRWMWWASVTGPTSLRTCPACWAMHGTTHPVGTPGPEGHQQCRCARLPVVKPWSALGVHGVDEPASITADGETTFRALPRDRQVAVMGAARLALLDSGLIGWADLVVRRDNPNWRPSYRPSPLRDLQAIAARRRAA